MAEEFGSDFMTIVDEDGTEYELEVLSTLEYNGCTYLAKSYSMSPAFAMKQQGIPLICSLYWPSG